MYVAKTLKFVGDEESLSNTESLKIVQWYSRTNVSVTYDIHFDVFTWLECGRLKTTFHNYVFRGKWYAET